jgi:hypothetical protein
VDTCSTKHDDNQGRIFTLSPSINYKEKHYFYGMEISWMEEFVHFLLPEKKNNGWNYPKAYCLLKSLLKKRESGYFLLK